MNISCVYKHKPLGQWSGFLPPAVAHCSAHTPLHAFDICFAAALAFGVFGSQVHTMIVWWRLLIGFGFPWIYLPCAHSGVMSRMVLRVANSCSGMSHRG